MTITQTENLQKAVVYTKAILGISGTDQDTLISYLCKSANAMIKGQTSLDLLNITEQVEYFDGTGTRQLFLTVLPIIEITKVEYNNNQRGTAYRQEVDENDYVVNELGVLSFAFNTYRGKQNMRVTYTAGFANFDVVTYKYEDVKLALALIAGNLYNTRKQGGISNESVSGTSLTYDKKAISTDVEQLLDKYIDYAI